MECCDQQGSPALMKLKRPRLLLPSRRGDPRASAVAFVLQVVIIALVVPLLIVPIAIDYLRDDFGDPVAPERISFITAVPRTEGGAGEPQRAGGDGRAVRDDAAEGEAVPTTPLVAPREIPTAVFPAPTAPRVDPGGTGPVIGGGGPTRGIQPAFTDRRLWLPESEIIQAPGMPLSRADSLRVMLAERTEAYLDSLAQLPADRRPGDWTFERGGRRYGVDEQFIRLGNFSLPTAVLALLPMNQQANPIARERALRLDAMRAEIQMQAARASRDDEFRAAVRALRERKERERQEAEAARRGEVSGTPR